jgi:hypothetical protein
MTMRYTPHSRRRGAFTLVEMLVSTALIIFILVILSSVFTTGISALRSLRGVGHLQDHLRYTMSTLRNDLAQPHFGRETDGLHGPNLSQQRLDLYDWTPPKEGFFRILQLPEYDPQFVTLRPSVLEGNDGDQLKSFVATRHALHFTVRAEPNTAQGSGRDQFFFTNSFNPALVPPIRLQGPQLIQSLRMGQAPGHINNDGTGTVYSSWAEVAYFLRPTGQKAGSSDLYALYRRRRLLVDNKDPNYPDSSLLANYFVAGTQGVPVIPVPTQAPDVSWYDPQPPTSLSGAGPFYINTPANINVPYRRFGMIPYDPSDPAKVRAPAGLFKSMPLPQLQPPLLSTGYYQSINDAVSQVNGNVAGSSNPGGDDILLENVLSFEIKVSWDIPSDSRINRATQGVGLPSSFQLTNSVSNSDYPFDYLPPSPTGYGNDMLRSMNNTVPAAGPGQGVGVFDTWRGEDYIFQPAGLSPQPPTPYRLWNDRYENGGPTPTTPQQKLQADVTIPLRIRVKAIQIHIRVWDIKTQQARQVTIVQDL